MRRRLLVITIIIIIGFVIVTLLILLSIQSRNVINLQDTETKIVKIQGEDISFTYQGSGSFHIAVIINGHERAGYSVAVTEDEIWYIYGASDSAYGYDVEFEYRVLDLTPGTISFEFRDAQ